MFINLRIITAFLSLFLFFSGTVSGQKLSLHKLKAFDLPEGYECNVVEKQGETTLVACPDTRSFFYYMIIKIP